MLRQSSLQEEKTVILTLKCVDICSRHYSHLLNWVWRLQGSEILKENLQKLNKYTTVN